MLNIRIATSSDATAIALLGRITFTETFGHLFADKSDLLGYCAKTFSVEKISAGLQKSNNIFWVATVDDLPVGYVKLKLNSSSELIASKNVCQLQKIYVLKDFLAMKIGSKLQTHLLAKAKEKQFDAIWLSVLESNERAIKFYEKNHFISVGHHEFQIGKEKFNFIVMAKELNSTKNTNSIYNQ